MYLQKLKELLTHLGLKSDIDLDTASYSDIELYYKRISGPRYKHIRLNLLNKQTENNLEAAIRKKYAAPDMKLFVIHHSHHLSTHLMNAKRYDRNRINGITLVVGVSASLPEPIYNFAVCSKHDTYSRLVGRVEAKQALLKQDLQHPSLTTTNLSKHYKTIVNSIVDDVAPRIKKKVKAEVFKINPLALVNEESRTLDIKQMIANKFEIAVKDIQVKFEYVRYTDNNLLGNMLLTTKRYSEVVKGYPNDNVRLNSFGGFTLVLFVFEKDSKTYMLGAMSECVRAEAFSKRLGRIASLGVLLRSTALTGKKPKRKSDNYTLSFTLSDRPVDDVLLSQASNYALGAFYQLTCDQYIPVA